MAAATKVGLVPTVTCALTAVLDTAVVYPGADMDKAGNAIMDIMMISVANTLFNFYPPYFSALSARLFI